MPKASTLSKLRKEDREIRRNLVIDAAQKVFGRKTYDQASMREIAREAGMGVSSIYTYFENQEILFLEAVLRETNELIDELEIMVSKESKISLERLMSHHLDFYIEHENHWRMITHFFLFGNISPESSERLNNFMRRLLTVFDIIFKKMNYAGDVRMMSHAFFTCLNGILISYRKYPGREDDEIRSHMKRVAEIIRNMLLPYVEANIVGAQNEKSN